MSGSLYHSKISGIGSYVPPKVVTNEDLSRIMDTSDEWITQRTGIKQRYWVEENVTTSDLALEASKRAIQKSGIEASQIDLIIFATLSPDHDFPGTGVFLQQKLGLPGIPALDIRQQCSGFLYGLSIADQFVKTGMYQNVLLVGAEVHSKGLDKTTEGRDLSVLFGDGAGAAVVSRTSVSDPLKDSHILSTHLHADGKYAKELWLEAPGMGVGASRMDEKILEEKRHFPTMNGKTVFLHASKAMPEVIIEGLKHNQLSVDDIDLFVFHQANIRINEMVSKGLKIPPEKVFNTIDRFGNTTAATIPLGMDEAMKADVLKPGMLVASAAFGSGFTWASSIFRY